MVQEQAKVLARRNKLQRGAGESNVRIEREANAIVSKNVRKLVAEGEYKSVMELLKASTSLSVVPFVAALRSLMQANRKDEVHELFLMMRSKDILPPAAAFAEVVEYFARVAQDAPKAAFLFADLKTAYVPPASTYEAMWFLHPFESPSATASSQSTLSSLNPVNLLSKKPASSEQAKNTSSKESKIMSLTHTALWREMADAGVAPSERVLLSYLRSIVDQYLLPTNDSPKTKLNAVLLGKLSSFERTCRAVFGFASTSLAGHRGPSISGTLVKAWLETVFAVVGPQEAFRVAATMYNVPESGQPPRNATLLLESGATAWASVSGTVNPPKSVQSTPLQVIPTEFSPYEPLIEIFHSYQLPHAVISAWNLMSPKTQLSAASSTIALVATASHPTDLEALFGSMPAASRSHPNLLLTFLSLAQSLDENSRNALQSKIINVVDQLQPSQHTTVAQFKQSNFFAEAKRVLGAASELQQQLLAAEKRFAL